MNRQKQYTANPLKSVGEPIDYESFGVPPPQVENGGGSD